jgi:hypothetical protein
MANDFGKRRSEIISFLKGLNEREKLVVLAFLSNDGAIGARVPGLTASIVEMHRRHHKYDLLKLAEAKQPTLDLGLLARRKGCKLERAVGLPDCWRIRRLAGNVARHLDRNTLTLRQALEALRALPDRGSAAKP